MIKQCLYPCSVMHRRYGDLGYRFNYDIFTALFDIDALEETNLTKRWFSLNRWNLISLRAKDHLPAGEQDFRAWVERCLVDKGVQFYWNTEVTKILFPTNEIVLGHDYFKYDELIFAVGKSGIDFAQQLSNDYKLPTEPKSVQIGVRFEAPQKYFQKLIDISYDFKLYQKFDNVSLRSFCTNNNAAYVAVEETYGDVTYNGHAKKGKEFENQMTNFGILMEIKGIEDPFKWSRDLVSKIQYTEFNADTKIHTGLYYSPNNYRQPGLTSEGTTVSAYPITSDQLFNVVEPAFDGYFSYVTNFINDMNKVFEFGDDWGMYIPEVKYLSPEPLVNYHDLSLKQFPNVHFVGDALSARGITVAGSQGIYVAEKLIQHSHLVDLTSID